MLGCGKLNVYILNNAKSKLQIWWLMWQIRVHYHTTYNKETRPLLVAACGCNGMKNYCTICWDAKSSYICIANIFVVFTRKKDNCPDVSEFCKPVRL